MNVKICGVTRPEDALAAAQAGAWAVGLIFAPSSPRRVTLQQARAVADALPKGVLRVGVFMDQSLEEIRAVMDSTPLELIQMHGAGSDGLYRALGAERCIHAAAESEAAYLLLDRPRRKGRSLGGPLDWNLARAACRRHPRVLLAGGLTPENVSEAVRTASPWGVDVSSGVESAPGVKDARKIAAFIKGAKS